MLRKLIAWTMVWSFAFLSFAHAEKKTIVFMAGTPSHGYGSHEHNAGCLLLARSLQIGMPDYDVTVHRNGWPKDPKAFDGADTIIMYCDGGGRHPVNANLEQIDKLADKGVGIVCIHYGVEVPKGPSGEKFLKWIGGYFETNWSVNPHWVAKFDKFPDHPITTGVKPFESDDEWYYHMRFREGMKGVTPILSNLPPASTLVKPDGSLARPDNAHNNNPHVRDAVLKRKEPQHVAWASERDGGGRGFGFTGGHNHWNWGDENFRKLVLNAIVWTAHGEVPKNGVNDKPIYVEDLEENQDYQAKPNFDREGTIKKYKLKSRGGKSAKKRNNAKPVFASKTITPNTPNHSVDINVELKGAKKLYLVVNDGGNGFSCDWADWAEPRLTGDQGEKRLTDLKWVKAQAGYGQVRVDKNCNGRPMRINGKAVEYGIGTHANSIIEYDVPAGFTHFKARGGLDNGGTDQGACGNAVSVQFLVYTQQPPIYVASSGGGSSASRDPADAIDALDVADGLEASLFVAEPDLLNPSNMEIDHKGRIWVCEIVNYRNKGKREEGDRILVLEDTDGDGKCDRLTNFYQGNDVNSPHGVCVLPTPTDKGTKVIISAADKVQIFTDKDGDLKADGPGEVLFSGISGTQHDHGIHAFTFGPDGKLYFNFGNNGRQIKDGDGKTIIDKAGNEVIANRQPYQEGMVFRCNMDGSDFETLGWNFRNNWMVTVDSFGTIWQSDNDDDGNKGVRINFVMEFGNYGYKDEFTGAGWKTPRTGMHTEIPKQHWHLNDPGVVPNFVQTGQGSPTGITVYEGSLLPKVFQGQVIHCDAGPSVCRSYPAVADGAGYKCPEIVNVLHGARDNWYRPSDVKIAPDGSLFIADWYDPGVGGHNARSLDSGRIFRVAPPNHEYRVPTFDFKSLEGLVEALKNPNYTVRYIAWKELHARGEKAENVLAEMYLDDNPRFQARALWLLAKIRGRGEYWVNQAVESDNADIRIVGIRIARQLGHDVIPIISKLSKDKSAAVRRELLIALRHNESSDAPKLWAELASQHDGKDRWYLEALGLSADKQWDKFFAAWLEKAGDKWNTPAGRDIIWRSRSKAACELLAKIVSEVVKGESAGVKAHERYMRAFDFHPKSPEKEKALQDALTAILGA